jgi:hypothetical protein
MRLRNNAFRKKSRKMRWETRRTLTRIFIEMRLKEPAHFAAVALSGAVITNFRPDVVMISSLGPSDTASSTSLSSIAPFPPTYRDSATGGVSSLQPSLQLTHATRAQLERRTSHRGKIQLNVS